MKGTASKLEESNPKEWANKHEINIDYDVDKENEEDDSSIFNLTVFDEKPGTREIFLTVSPKRALASYGYNAERS